jgi:hypothetical protein
VTRLGSGNVTSAMCAWAAALALTVSAAAVSAGPATGKRGLIAKTGVEEIIFAVRQPGKDGHWYANFGYWLCDPNRKLYGPGGRLCRLNLRTGKLTALLDDPRGGDFRDPYPLSEQWLLAARGAGVLLMDAGGQTTELYALPPADVRAGLQCHEPRPLRPRPRERRIASQVDPARATGRLVGTPRTRPTGSCWPPSARPAAAWRRSSGSTCPASGRTCTTSAR